MQDGDLSHDRFTQYAKLRREGAQAQRRAKQRKPLNFSKQDQRDEKNAFFKEVTIRHRKNQKNKGKFDRLDGF